MKSLVTAFILSASALTLTPPAALAQATAPAVKPAATRNVVLVHGAFADGWGWRKVYDTLSARGYRVTIVQNPLTSMTSSSAAPVPQGR